MIAIFRYLKSHHLGKKQLNVVFEALKRRMRNNMEKSQRVRFRLDVKKNILKIRAIKTAKNTREESGRN